MQIETTSQKLHLATQNYCKHTENYKQPNYFYK